jgi:spermidine/putrescine transport system ATP-binding protein
VNTVFQQYALFPHRTVGGNVAFGLEMNGCPPGDVPGRVARALEMVRLPGFADRRIEQLSGGQRQRVALARAVVLEPEVLLLDEPMAALDLKLRKEMQVEVKNLQERLKITFLFVTHDQEEALTMSDRIAVMSQGRIEQLGAPEELYERPRTRFVADFLAVKNILEVEVVGVADGKASLRTAGGTLLSAADDGGYSTGSRAFVGVRPERISLSEAGENRFAGTLDDEIYLGDFTDWRIRVGEEVLTVSEGSASARHRKRGDAVRLSFPADAVLRLEGSAPEA